jgi:hypothetical protein
MAFDLPAALVTRDRLERLYAQHEYELLSGSAAPASGSGTDEAAPRDADERERRAAPVIMHCR